MASFNGERYLPAQLDSIAAQTRSPDQLLISDDGSTDGTLDVAREFAARVPFAVEVSVNPTRLGYVENFLGAARRADGDLIAFADQDDVWLPQKLERAAGALERDPGLAMVAHAARVVDSDLTPLGTRYPRVDVTSTREPGRTGPTFGGYPGFTIMLRRKYLWFDGWDRRPPSLPPDDDAQIPHDVWANLLCAALGRVLALDEELALYRRHAQNTSEFLLPRTAQRLRDSAKLRGEEVEFFARIANATAARAAYLKQAAAFAASLGPEAVGGLGLAAAGFDRYADAMMRRAETYRTNGLPSRLRKLGAAARIGDYRPTLEGGLGRTALLRDLTGALAPPASSGDGQR